MVKHYYKTKGYEQHDVVCIEPCLFVNNGVNIGSVSCQECKHNKEYCRINGFIICEKIKEATNG